MAKQNFAAALQKNTRANAGQELKKLKSKEYFDFRIIPYEKIRPSNFNDFEITDVQEIKESIRKYGLLHNILLAPLEGEEYEYEIVGGEQRFLAIGELLEEGDDKFKQGIPSKVLSKDTPTRIRRILLKESNLKRRNLSPAELAKHISDLEEEYRALNEETGSTESITKQIAESTGIGERQVQRYSAVNTKLIPELKEIFEESKISIEKAAQFANMDESSQRIVFEFFKEGKSASKKEIELVKEASLKKEEAYRKELELLQKNIEEYKNKEIHLTQELEKKKELLKGKEKNEESLLNEIEEERAKGNPDSSKLHELENQILLLKEEKSKLEKSSTDVKKNLSETKKQLKLLQQEKKNNTKELTLSESEKAQIQEKYEISIIIGELKKILTQFSVKEKNFEKKYNEKAITADELSEVASFIEKILKI